MFKHMSQEIILGIKFNLASYFGRTFTIWYSFDYHIDTIIFAIIEFAVQVEAILSTAPRDIVVCIEEADEHTIHDSGRMVSNDSVLWQYFNSIISPHEIAFSFKYRHSANMNIHIYLTMIQLTAYFKTTSISYIMHESVKRAMHTVQCLPWQCAGWGVIFYKRHSLPFSVDNFPSFNKIWNWQYETWNPDTYKF